MIPPPGFAQTAQDGIRHAMKTDFFAGGMVLALIGSALAYGRALPVRLFRFIEHQFVVEVDVLGDDPVYGWLTTWLDTQRVTQRSRTLTATSNQRRRRHAIFEDSTDNTPRILFTPAPGTHYLWFQGRLVVLRRTRKEAQTKDGGFAGYHETMVLRSFGRSTRLIRALLEEARELSQRESKAVEVFALRYGDWRTLASVFPRPLHTVFLAAGLVDRVLQDLESFLQSREWYTDRGIPWRRAHLYEGPPGTGKSSLAAALAGQLRLNLYICSISDRTMTDETLLNSVQEMRDSSVLLIEDVDCVVSGRSVTGDGGVTFAGLLNALDGVVSKPGLITIMTTNHVDRLDPALVRRGRVDAQYHLGYADQVQAEALCRHFYQHQDLDSGVATGLGQAGAGRPMAVIQGVLLDHKDDPERALQILQGLPLAVPSVVPE